MSCRTYQVSVASHALSQYSQIDFPWRPSQILSNLTIQGPINIQTLDWTVGNVSVLVIVGIIMFLIALILVLAQFCGNVFSSPKKRYWVWAIRATRLFLTLSSYIVAMLAASGLFYVYSLYGNVSDPIIGFEQVLAEKYRLSQEVANTIYSEAHRFGFPVPSEALAAIQFVQDLGYWHTKLVAIESMFLMISAYAHLILAAGFGLIICICVMATLFAITKHRCIPTCTVLFILVATLFIWIFATVSGAGSLILARECNKGLDSEIIPFTVDNTEYSVCLRAAFGHYLFCQAWEQNLGTSESSSCQNPFVSLTNLTEELINYLKSHGSEYSKEIQTLERLVFNVDALDSCNESQSVYTESKQDLCWDVTNSMIQVTLLCILQSPILIILLIYVLFGWHRFNLQNLPYGSSLIFNKHSDVPRDDQSLLIEDTEELGIIGDFSENESYDTSLYYSTGQNTTPSNGFLENWTGGWKKMELKNVQKIIQMEKQTIAFTAVMLVIVFLTIFVWVGMVNNNFGVHSEHC